MTTSVNASAFNTFEKSNRNLAAVFQLIREQPDCSRTEIGRFMPLSLQTVTNVVQELLHMEMIEERERARTGRREAPPAASL
ncbi:MarR family transcriptional regulator [Rhizobium pusense]|nr:MarR family transcriptional regulator [Agrobacterium pusense]